MKNHLPSVVCFGEILWDVFPSGRKAGGAPMNVAVNLRKLGINAQVISRIGCDEMGVALDDFLKLNGLDTFYIQKDKINDTGVVKVKIDENKNAKYDIIFPSAWDFIEYNTDIEKIVQASEHVVFGSLSARNQDSFRTLLAILEKAKYKVFDVNLRHPHYNRELIETLLHKADIVKVNEEEIAILFDWMGSTGDTISVISKRLIENYKIDQVIITLGEKGAMVSYGDKVFQHPGFKVDAEDTVGSGDAFLAAFLANQIKGKDTNECLEFACATACYVVTQNGANPPYDETQIIQFIKEQNYEEMTTKLI